MVFSQMGPLVPVIFFLAVLVAALISSISMFEVVVAWLIDEKKLSRTQAVLLVYFLALALGAVCALLPRVFAFCDFATSNIFMKFGAFIFVVVVGWIMPRRDATAALGGSRFFAPVYFLIKWVCPTAILAIAVTNLL